MIRSKRTIAVVTGASGRLGGVITVELVGAGYDVLMVGRNAGALRRTEEKAQSVGKGTVHVCACDLEAPEAVSIIVSAADHLGGCDVLINNAAVQGPIGPAWEIDPVEFERTLRVNFLIPTALCRAVVPGMITRGAGWIVNLSGGGAAGPRPFFTAYGAAKTALVRYGETLAAELETRGVRVNSVAPGVFASGMTKTVAAASEFPGASEKKTADHLLSNNDDENALKAAKLIGYLIDGPGRDVTGKLISAVWDPWEELHLRWNDIRAKDLYTLRRVVPTE
jgi:NAD(P)-dependent dehydrogenase (short-subunit alcohol dehydrogenase family)